MGGEHEGLHCAPSTRVDDARARDGWVTSAELSFPEAPLRPCPIRWCCGEASVHAIRSCAAATQTQLRTQWRSARCEGEAGDAGWLQGAKYVFALIVARISAKAVAPPLPPLSHTSGWRGMQFYYFDGTIQWQFWRWGESAVRCYLGCVLCWMPGGAAGVRTRSASGSGVL